MQESRDAFEMDGSVHYRDEDCDCRPKPCARCANGWEHYQAMYGGYARECDLCGAPDAKESRPSISAARINYLENGGSPCE
jgi:hypothetical protein